MTDFSKRVCEIADGKKMLESKLNVHWKTFGIFV